MQVLCPLPHTPIIYGIGLNYKSHIAETKIPPPSHPSVFTKPPDALNGPFSHVVVNPSCLNLDYEGELVIVVGQDCKNLASREEAVGKILGYTVGNDVSSRWWQMPQQGGSHGFAKGFDGFAPVGPVIAAPKAVGGHGEGGIKSQTIVTGVNGEERQRSKIDDLLFDAVDLLMI